MSRRDGYVTWCLPCRWRWSNPCSESGESASANLRSRVSPEDKGNKEGDVALSGSSAKSTTPFFIGESLPPIPAKLVTKIQRGEFVDMAELLRDNIKAVQRRTKDSGASGCTSSQSQREVPDIFSWIQCFGTYMCIVAAMQSE